MSSSESSEEYDEPKEEVEGQLMADLRREEEREAGDLVYDAKKDKEMPSMEKENGVDIECGDSETVQMAQVSCCMTIKVFVISLAVSILSPFYSLHILCGFVH